MSIVDRIKIKAKEKKITLSYIEKELGFSKSSIRKWDLNSPSCDKIIKLASFLNVSTDYILLGKSNIEDSKIESNTEKVFTPDENELIKEYRKLDLKGKTKVNNIIYNEIERINQIGDKEANWGIKKNY